MDFVAFGLRFPDIAKRETRVVHISGRVPLVPVGSYALIDNYCTDTGCDCRKVMVNIVDARDPSICLATIGFGWETADYYAQWYGDKKLANTMMGSYLEVGGAQSEHAHSFLALWDQIIQDKKYVARIKKHYSAMKS